MFIQCPKESLLGADKPNHPKTKGVHFYDNMFQNDPSLQRYDGCFFIKQQVAIEPE